MLSQTSEGVADQFHVHQFICCTMKSLPYVKPGEEPELAGLQGAGSKVVKPWQIS